MKYILQNDKWKVTYIDSTNVEHSFLHPTQIKNLPKFIEEEITELLIIDEEKIKEIFSSDSITENIVNSTTLLTESEFWDEDPVSINESVDTLGPLVKENQDLINNFVEQLASQQTVIDQQQSTIDNLQSAINQHERFINTQQSIIDQQQNVIEQQQKLLDVLISRVDTLESQVNQT